MSLSERLKSARKKLGISQMDLASKMGWNNSMKISQYEKEKTAPKINTIIEFSRILGVTPEWLQFGVGEDKGDQSERLEENKVPLLRFDEIGDWNNKVEIKRSIEFISFIRPNKNIYALKIESDYMSCCDKTSFDQESIIIIDPNKIPKQNSYVIAQIGENDFIFRQYKTEASRKYLTPLNKQYKAEEFQPSWEIVGVVIANINMLDVG